MTMINSSTLDQTKIYDICFYVDGALDVWTAQPHATPWADLAACRQAAKNYIDWLNSWWLSVTRDLTQTFLDYESGIVEDGIHPGVRVAVFGLDPSFGWSYPSDASIQVCQDGTDFNNYL